MKICFVFWYCPPHRWTALTCQEYPDPRRPRNWNPFSMFERENLQQLRNLSVTMETPPTTVQVLFFYKKLLKRYKNKRLILSKLNEYLNDSTRQRSVWSNKSTLVNFSKFIYLFFDNWFFDRSSHFKISKLIFPLLKTVYPSGSQNNYEYLVSYCV